MIYWFSQGQNQSEALVETFKKSLSKVKFSKPGIIFTVHELVTVLYALRFHGLDAILYRPGTLYLDLMSSVFLTRELVSILWLLFPDERWRFSVHHRFVYSLSRSFQFSFLIIGKFHSKIIRYVDIMSTMCFPHCICFYGFKQDQLRSTIFDSITN